MYLIFIAYRFLSLILIIYLYNLNYVNTIFTRHDQIFFPKLHYSSREFSETILSNFDGSVTGESRVQRHQLRSVIDIQFNSL